MAGSNAFANYESMSQQLRDSVDSFVPSELQTTDDAKNFESQFFVGAALHQKMKVTDGITKMFTKSTGKVADAVKGKTKAQIQKLLETGKEKAKTVADNLKSKITGVDNTPPAINPSASPSKLDQLQKLSNDATEQVKQTTSDIAKAEQGMIDSRDTLKTANEAKAAADATVETNSARAASQAGGPIKASDQVSDAVDRVAANDAQTAVDNATQGVADAENARNGLVDKLAQHQNTADNAAKDLQNASADEDEISNVSSGVSTAVEDGEKAIKVVKDVDKVAEGSEEVDPLGLVIAGIGAIAATIIGRRLQVHKLQFGDMSKVATSYTSTLGA